MYLAFFEFIGTSELMVILVAALVLFGPRKLPQISKQIGKGLAEFKKASEDFRQTWENEVTREFTMQDTEVGRAMLPPEAPVTSNSIGRGQLTDSIPESASTVSSTVNTGSDVTNPASEKPEANETTQHTRKRDWL